MGELICLLSLLLLPYMLTNTDEKQFKCDQCGAATSVSFLKVFSLVDELIDCLSLLAYL